MSDSPEAGRKIGICIAGYGEFAKKELHPRLARMGKCEVKYLYHPDPVKAAAYGPLGVSSLDAVLGDEAVDAFIIASPNDQHAGLLARLTEFGLHHIFVEKPLVDSTEEAIRLLPSNDKIFMVGHCHRRESIYRRAKELIERGALGRLVSVAFNYSSSKVFTIRKDEWRASVTRTDLGPLAMVGSHCIDTIHYLFGGVESVYARLSNLTRVTESPDTSSVVLNLENGATVLLQCNYNVPIERSCFISGTDGAIYIDGGKIWLRPGRETYLGARTERQELPTEKNDPITEELQEFLDAIRTDKKVETGYQEGLAVVKVLEACRRSAKENTVQRP